MNVSKDFKCKVNITVSNIDYSANASSLIQLSKLKADTYTATVTFSGDMNYKDKVVNIYFRIYRLTLDITADINNVTYQTLQKTVINLTNKTNRTVTITVIGKIFTKIVTNNLVTIDLDGLSA